MSKKSTPSIFWKVFKIGFIFGLSMGCFFFFTSENRLEVAIPAGLLAGLFTGVGMFFLNKFLLNRCESQRAKFPEKSLLKEGEANQLFKYEARGGWLILTHEFIHFRPHFLNFNTKDFTLSLKEIEKVKKWSIWGFSNNILILHTRNQSKAFFIVDKNQDWESQISTQLLRGA